jgi:ankyrin repeat protein
MVACYAGHLNIVQLLCEKGADWTKRDRGGSTALHYAVDGGQESVVAHVIQNKLADVNEQDASQWTPLLRAGKVTGSSWLASCSETL